MKSSSMKPVTVKVNNNKKKAKFNLSHDVNTTYDWGEVQPLLAKFMLPDSSINVNMEQLTRLAPMVVPTFGRVKMKNIAHFVPIKEIFPNWEYFLAKNPVSRPTATGSTTFVPYKIPNINTSVLTSFALAGAKINWYVSNGLSSETEEPTMWYHYDNQGSYTNIAPQGNVDDIQAGRQLLARLLNMTNSQTATPKVLNSISYNGPYINTALLTKGNNVYGTAGTRVPAEWGLTNDEQFFDVPAISTMYPQTIDTNIFGMNGYTHSANDERISPTNTAALDDDHITFDGADLIWESDMCTAEKRAATNNSIWGTLTTTKFDNCKIRIVFRLSSFGKRLRKVMIACGYNFSLNDDTNVSILPLMSYYKAWWDSYAPEREKNFYQSNCWKLSQFCCDANNNCDLTSVLPQNGNTDIRIIFKKFIMEEVGNCFATEPVTTISAATDEIIDSVTQYGNQDYVGTVNEVLKDWYEQMRSQTGGPDDEVNSLTNPGHTTQYPLITIGDQNRLTQPVLDALKKAYIYTNKFSVAGHAMEEILRMNGMGKYVEECKGKFIAQSDETIKISDVVATADTRGLPSNIGIKGAALGQYGGRGLGMGTDQFSYSTDVHGYLMIISSIIPESGYTNSVDLTLECINHNQLYNPEFDGLNYEAVQKKQIVGSTLVQNRTDTSHNDTFGFLPTYSKWKMCNNIANGDFSLNSQKYSMMPYTLDKYIPVNDVNVRNTFINTTGNGHAEVCAVTPTFKYGDLPNAGEDYRYINKMPWNGNYNRIFSLIGDDIDWETIVSNNNGAYLYNSFEYDNFLTHNVFNISYYAPMKSIEDSYSTYDEDDTAATGGISKA